MSAAKEIKSEIIEMLSVIEDVNSLESINEFVKIVQLNEKNIVKGDKSINIEGLFGIWAENPRDINQIRKKVWC